MAELFVGIDSGTQGTKVVVVDRGQRRIVSQASASHPMIEADSGLREQEPEWWIGACSRALENAFHDSGMRSSDVKAIGVSGQQHGMVALDQNGAVIRPAKLWCDTETFKQAEALTERLGGEQKVIQLIGNPIAAGFTASKIVWLKDNEPSNYDRLRTVFLPHDYINYWLTGEKKCECGDASGTAYFDVRRRSWSREVLNAIDESGKLAEALPRLIASHEPVGIVRGEIAARFGFKNDVIVSSGGGDNMMAAIGTGNVVPGVVTASLGTSGAIYSFSNKPIVDDRGELAAFCSSDGHWLPLVCTMNVTVSTELTRELLGLDIHTLNDKAMTAPIGSGGVMLLPYFNGERTPALPTARATLYGLSSTNMSSENFCRASMEGPTLGLRYGLDVLKRNGIVAREIRLVGGGSKSEEWRRIVANVFGCPVVCPVTEEAGALGAALQAMWCYIKEPLENITTEFVTLDELTRIEPKAHSVKQYDELYQRYLKLNEAMKAIYS
ncbi:MAG: xylulokinase [Acidobacteria bacterium]|nr:xylulokinase [Acidobacteriota bacterium]